MSKPSCDAPPLWLNSKFDQIHSNLVPGSKETYFSGFFSALGAHSKDHQERSLLITWHHLMEYSLDIPCKSPVTTDFLKWKIFNSFPRLFL